MSNGNGVEAPKYNRGRRGSVDDTIKEFLNPKLEFKQEQLPKGSSAFQILLHQAEEETKTDSGNESDKDEEDMKRPSRAYMGRRRNTIATNYGHNDSMERQFRKMSLAPIPEGQRGRAISHLLAPPPSERTRSLSPAQRNKLRRNSVHHVEKGFGSTLQRETKIA